MNLNTTTTTTNSHNSTMSTTTVSAIRQNIDTDAVFVWSGAIGLTATLFVTVVLVSDRRLLKSSALIVGLTFANWLINIYLVVSGVFRQLTPNGERQPASAFACMIRLYPLMHPLALICSSVFLCLTGVERVLAVRTPGWFRNHNIAGSMWRVTGMVLAVLLASAVFVAVAVSVDVPDTNTYCSVVPLFGKMYTGYTRTASGVGGTVATVLTVCSLLIGLQRIRKLPLLSGEAGRVRKQLQLTRSMLCVSFLDFTLVVVPSVLNAVNSVIDLHLILLYNGFLSNVCFAVNATLVVVPYLVFNVRFRAAAVRLLRRIVCCNKPSLLPSVESINYITPARRSAQETTRSRKAA